MRFEQLPNIAFGLLVGVVAFFALKNGFQPADPGPPTDAAFFASLNGPSEFTLVKFGAEWCPPCRAIEPELDSLAARMRGRVRVIKVNVDQRPDLARHYHVSSIPRLLLFSQGQVVGDKVGGMDAAGLEAWIASTPRR